MADINRASINNQDIRAFVAIELPPELNKRLKTFQFNFKDSRQSFVKWVDPDAIHLTLKFLGNVSIKRLDEVKNELAKTVKAGGSFNLTTEETGCFPNLKGIRVFWLGMRCESEQLLSLHKDIDISLAKLGFPGENRPFASHLTLARLKDGCLTADRVAFGELIRQAEFTPRFSMEVNSVSLMRSQLTPAGPIYSRLAEFKLEGGKGSG